MPAGRPPIPTALKVLRGNPGKRALPKDEPKPAAQEPVRPGDLTDGGLIEWERVVPLLLGMRVLTAADGGALGMLCNDLAELKAVQGAIRETGSTVTNEKSGAVKINPLYHRESELHRRVTLGWSQFGLTPSSRTKVATAPQEKHRAFDLDAETG